MKSEEKPRREKQNTHPRPGQLSGKKKVISSFPTRLKSAEVLQLFVVHLLLPLSQTKLRTSMTVSCTEKLPGISIIKGETNPRPCNSRLTKKGRNISSVVVNTGTNPRRYGSQTDASDDFPAFPSHFLHLHLFDFQQPFAGQQLGSSSDYSSPHSSCRNLGKQLHVIH